MPRTGGETVTVVGFSNCGDVALCVNGHLVGSKKPDGVCVVEWRDVSLAKGENVIELHANDRVVSRRIVRE